MGLELGTKLLVVGFMASLYVFAGIYGDRLLLKFFPVEHQKLYPGVSFFSLSSQYSGFLMSAVVAPLLLAPYVFYAERAWHPYVLSYDPGMGVVMDVAACVINAYFLVDIFFRLQARARLMPFYVMHHVVSIAVITYISHARVIFQAYTLILLLHELTGIPVTLYDALSMTGHDHGWLSFLVDSLYFLSWLFFRIFLPATAFYGMTGHVLDGVLAVTTDVWVFLSIILLLLLQNIVWLLVLGPFHRMRAKWFGPKLVGDAISKAS
mmetsp:Transcript_34336/g.96783  ORF Transcript_34336/g.96783 Transcript_34336/m.96783 type:complete len:265 (-) Transcript_34336:1371-2165(-)